MIQNPQAQIKLVRVTGSRPVPAGNPIIAKLSSDGFPLNVSDVKADARGLSPPPNYYCCYQFELKFKNFSKIISFTILFHVNQRANLFSFGLQNSLVKLSRLMIPMTWV